MPPTPRMTARTQVNAPFTPKRSTKAPADRAIGGSARRSPANPQVTGYDFRELSSRSPDRAP